MCRDDSKGGVTNFRKNDIFEKVLRENFDFCGLDLDRKTLPRHNQIFVKKHNELSFISYLLPGNMQNGKMLQYLHINPDF